MTKTDGLYRLRNLLRGPRAVPAAELMEKLQVSRSTLTRYLNDLGDTLKAPVTFDREAGGYRLEKAEGRELAGLWFPPDEIHALLTMWQLLSRLDPGGLLASHIEPLRARLTELLGAAHDPAAEVARRVSLQPLASRRLQLEHFEAVGSALLRRRRLAIRYRSRGKDEASQREISPQRLVHYRDNWYLDAWCHMSQALRRFAVDALAKAHILDIPAEDHPEALDARNDKGYGIFAGEEVKWATLRFTPERSRWVANETWHPDQQSRPLPDGGFELKLPYTHDTELLMDLLRQGPHVLVLDPPELREALIRLHEEAARNLRVWCSGYEHGEGENQTRSCVTNHKSTSTELPINQGVNDECPDS